MTDDDPLELPEIDGEAIEPESQDFMEPDSAAPESLDFAEPDSAAPESLDFAEPDSAAPESLDFAEPDSAAPDLPPEVESLDREAIEPALVREDWGEAFAEAMPEPVADSTPALQRADDVPDMSQHDDLHGVLAEIASRLAAIEDSLKSGMGYDI